jgi:hypothetical protein
MSTKNEQEWYKKFFEGTFLVKGWNARVKEVLKVVPDTDKASLEASLARVGEKIGREWSKDNQVRRIDTAMLKQWGEALASAKRVGPDRLVQEIEKIDAQVDDLLA